MSELCGTERGYGRHRRLKEPKCQPCKDAHNIVRRQKYNPDKNRQYRNTYLAKPEKKKLYLENAKKYDKKYNLSPEEKEQRRLKRRAATEERRRLKKAKRQAKYQAYLEEMAKKKQKRLEQLALEKQERARLRQERRDQERLGAEISKIIERELQQKARAVREAEKQAIREEKAKKKELLNNQHGTSYGDYSRCKKNNGTACQECRNAAAAHVREYNKQNIDKARAWTRASNNRRHRRAKNSEFYTTVQVLERWGRDCHICSEPIDFDAPSQCGKPGWERSLHLDHVIPLSLGGEDTLDNVKPAHAFCNITKGARLLPAI